MKKTLITVSILILTINIFAQFHSVGIQGGLSLCNISSKEYFDDSEFKIGFVGGLKYEYLLSNKYLLGADLLFNQRGFIYVEHFYDNMGNSLGDHNLDFVYNYISLPIKFGFILGNRYKFIPKIGLQPSVLISAKVTTPEFKNGEIIGDKTSIVTNNVSKFDLAGLLELEILYESNQNVSIFTSFSGTYSLTSFTNPEYMEQTKSRHYALTILVGLKYNINKN